MTFPRLTLEPHAKWFVYALIDPRWARPFYVGKGTRNRWKYHFYEAGCETLREEGGKKSETILSILALGLEPRVDLIAQFWDESAALELEAQIINDLRWHLTNKLVPYLNPASSQSPQPKPGKS